MKFEQKIMDCSAIKERNLMATGVYMFNGTLTHEELAVDRGMPWKPLDLLTAAL